MRQIGTAASLEKIVSRHIFVNKSFTIHNLLKNKKMKFKSFIAMLVTGLLCITLFSACSDDDDDKDKTYAYEMVLELTDAGDLSQDNIQVLNTTFAAMESQVGTQYATPAAVKRIFNENVSQIKKFCRNSSGGDVAHQDRKSEIRILQHGHPETRSVAGIRIQLIPRPNISCSQERQRDRDSAAFFDRNSHKTLHQA